MSNENIAAPLAGGAEPSACPFCGDLVDDEGVERRWAGMPMVRVVCVTCQASGPWCADDQPTVAERRGLDAWNRRAAASLTPEVIDTIDCDTCGGAFPHPHGCDCVSPAVPQAVLLRLMGHTRASAPKGGA